MPLQAQSQGIFGGSSIGSVSGCTFQVFNGPVKIIHQANKRRIIIESDDEDWTIVNVSLVELYVHKTSNIFFWTGIFFPQLEIEKISLNELNFDFTAM